MGLISKTLSYKLQEPTRGLVTPTQTPAEAALWLRAVREVSPPPIQRGLQSGKDPRSLQLQGGFCCIFSFEGLACRVHSSRRKCITPPPTVSKSRVLSTIHTQSFESKLGKQEQKNILEQNWLQWILTFCNSMFSLLCAP